MANMTELQTPLSQPWEKSHRWRPRVALEVPIKRAPLYALPDYISFLVVVVPKTASSIVILGFHLCF